MTVDSAHALVDALCGAPDDAAARVVEVLHAEAAALAWVRDTTGSYPAPEHVKVALAVAAGRLRDGSDDRAPGPVLIQVAADAVAGRNTSAA